MYIIKALKLHSSVFEAT